MNVKNVTEPTGMLIPTIGRKIDTNNWLESTRRSKFQLNILPEDHGALWKRPRGGAPTQ